MFPQSWDAAKIQAEVDSAWATRTPHPDGTKGKWQGVSASGIAMDGYESPRARITRSLGKADLQGATLQGQQIHFVKTNPDAKGELILGGSIDTQNLANKMGVPVQAPTELVWAYGWKP